MVATDAWAEDVAEFDEVGAVLDRLRGERMAQGRHQRSLGHRGAEPRPLVDRRPGTGRGRASGSWCRSARAAAPPGPRASPRRATRCASGGSSSSDSSVGSIGIARSLLALPRRAAANPPSNPTHTQRRSRARVAGRARRRRAARRPRRARAAARRSARRRRGGRLGCPPTYAASTSPLRAPRKNSSISARERRQQ